MGTGAHGAACLRGATDGLPSHRFLAMYGHVAGQGSVGITLAERRGALGNMGKLKQQRYYNYVSSCYRASWLNRHSTDLYAPKRWIRSNGNGKRSVPSKHRRQGFG